MNPEEVRKLLGGYATGNLTDAERDALFSAALEDQELFDSLMKEEALREVLEDPISKAQVLAALDTQPAHPAWWSWRPLIGAVAMAGIALAAVAIWRNTAEKPSTVIVAEVSKPRVQESAPAPAPVSPPPPVPTAVIEAPPPPVRKAMKRAEPATAVRDERRQKEKDANAPLADTAAALTKGEVQPLAGAAPQQQAATPSPMVQQQQQLSQAKQSVSVEAAPALNRAAAASGFRAASPVKEAFSADQSMDKKMAPLVTWTILRGDRELPPETVLDAGETIRLRIVSVQAGTLSLVEGGKVLASGTVEAGKPFDTPPIPFTTDGPHQLRLTLASPPVQPWTMTLTLNHAR